MSNESVWIIDVNGNGHSVLQIPEGVYNSLEEFLAERAGDPDEGTVNLDELEYNGDWYEYGYGKFKLIKGTELELEPVEVATEFETVEK